MWVYACGFFLGRSPALGGEGVRSLLLSTGGLRVVGRGGKGSCGEEWVFVGMGIGGRSLGGTTRSRGGGGGPLLTIGSSGAS